MVWAGSAKTNYDTWEQNNDIDSYSDLSYQQIEVTFGGKYSFTETFYSNAQLTYNTFDADEEYVYGDEDGNMYTAYLGFGWIF